MNVLIVLPSFSYRGGERIFYALARGLAICGHSVKMLTARVERQAFSVRKPVGLIRPSPFVNKLMQNNLIFLLFSLPYLSWLIFKNAEDVDIIDTESGFALWASILIGTLRKIPVVWMIFAFETRPFASPFVSKLFSLTVRKIDKFFARRANGFTCLAPRIRRAVRKYYGIENIKVTIPAIDTERFKRPNPAKILDKFNLLGRKILLLPAFLHPKKNQELAINVLARIIKAFPRVTLVLVGDGPDGKRLKKLVRKKGLEKNVVFAGVAREDKIADFYAASSLVLVCSKVENEGLSMTALEALANGKLPIVSAGAGVAEVLKNKGIDVVVKPSVGAFSQAIISYLRKSKKYEKMVKKGREWVLQELTLKKFGEHTLEVFDKALK